MSNIDQICGIDEAGRGPWAGPVCAAAVILDPRHPIEGLGDSKTISEKRRSVLEANIKEHALTFGVGWADPDEIDTLNIRQATHLAMRRAFDDLSVNPGVVLVDGNDAPNFGCPTEAIVKGDGSIPAISAASILAKCARDRLMHELDGRYPGYGFALHKGYGVKAHAEALERLGPSPIHRKSFKPVAKWIDAA